MDLKEDMFSRFIQRKGFDFILTMDCEGTNFDRNLDKNILNLEKHLKLTTDNDIYTVLFITPFFADMLYRLNLVERIKNNYKVVFGLHIHPDNLPEDILNKCKFINTEEPLLSHYTYEQQLSIIYESLNYLYKRGISPITGYRGGYFSINDDTEKALVKVSNIKWESHNVYRKEYDISNPILMPLPVYAYDSNEEFRIEYFESEKLIKMLKAAAIKNKKIVAVTHSYLLYDKDFHYERDAINETIYERLEKVIKEVNMYRKYKLYEKPLVKASGGGIYVYSYSNSSE